MSLAVITAERARCVCCHSTENVLRMVIADGILVRKKGWALCNPCRVRLEALLRASRKHGERMPKWRES